MVGRRVDCLASGSSEWDCLSRLKWFLFRRLVVQKYMCMRLICVKKWFYHIWLLTKRWLHNQRRLRPHSVMNCLKCSNGILTVSNILEYACSVLHVRPRVEILIMQTYTHRANIFVRLQSTGNIWPPDYGWISHGHGPVLLRCQLGPHCSRKRGCGRYRLLPAISSSIRSFSLNVNRLQKRGLCPHNMWAM